MLVNLIDLDKQGFGNYILKSAHSLTCFNLYDFLAPFLRVWKYFNLVGWLQNSLGLYILYRFNYVRVLYLSWQLCSSYFFGKELKDVLLFQESD